jgi:hypothetical protein
MFGIVYILAGIGLVASLLSYLVGMLLAKQEKLILEALQEQQVEVNAAEMHVKLEIQNDKVSLGYFKLCKSDMPLLLLREK